MFEELLELSIARARRHDGAVAVICVDIDDFRLVNDSLGPPGGRRAPAAWSPIGSARRRARPTWWLGAAATSS